MKRFFKIKNIAIAIAVTLVATAMVLLVCDRIVVSNAAGKAHSTIDSIKPAQVGLLLGTTPQTRIGGKTNPFFTHRINATEELYKAGKIKCILISGDENSLDGVNETLSMRDTLVAHGIPEAAIIQDGKGYRTLDSVVRMKKVYGVSQAIIISQRFHNERALYLAEHLGLDVHGMQAYNAQDPTNTLSLTTYAREYFARVKMFLDIMTGKQPTTLAR